MKIDDYIESLNTAGLALESAPQKGFVDLDLVNKAIADTRQFLIQIAPRMELGERLIADFRDELSAKIKALKISGSVALVSQAELLLKNGELNYENLKALRGEIDRAIGKVFGGHTLNMAGANSSGGNANRKLEDFR